MNHNGASLLQAAAVRILERYLREGQATRVMSVDGDADPARLSGVDIVCARGGDTVRIKVKPDAYFGTDPRKIADQDLVFYRGSSKSYAFETISHHVTREPGWMFNSVADELFYYFLAIAQTEAEVAALVAGPDDAFFSGLAVAHDELHVLPMPALKTWFEVNHEKYSPRPITVGDHSGWYRIVPVADIDHTVPGVSARGSVFSTLRGR